MTLFHRLPRFAPLPFEKVLLKFWNHIFQNFMIFLRFNNCHFSEEQQNKYTNALSLSPVHNICILGIYSMVISFRTFHVFKMLFQFLLVLFMSLSHFFAVVINMSDQQIRWSVSKNHPFVIITYHYIFTRSDWLASLKLEVQNAKKRELFFFCTFISNVKL